jgi:hypothetical protein
MDAFGFKTQGINYDKFRPRYPPSFITNCLAAIKHKNRYLDVATGTGILLFALSPHFAYSKGVDISKNMLEAAARAKEDFLANHPGVKVELGYSDVMGLPEDKEKFDLVTVGQAHHFFPGEAAMLKLRSQLSEGGCLSTFGYVIKEVISKNPSEDIIFNAFYSKIKPLFPIDRDDLHTFLGNKDKYPFERVFKSVERELAEVSLPMNKAEYLSYLRTMSGYNIYLEKFKEDPLAELEERGAEEVECVLYYFRITCHND